jgi:hypothetical protein
MTDLSLIHYGGGALFATAWLGILTFAALKAWNGWLAYKRAELDLITAGQRGSAEPLGTLSAATRIDVADLKERIRKLEAIAAGIDL